LNPNGLLHGVAFFPSFEIQRTWAHSAYGEPVTHGSCLGTVSADCGTLMSLNTSDPSWKLVEVAIWNW
jgi:hypothetical protein